MTVLDRVLQEVLRFLPPVGGGFRRIVKPCTYGGYQLPVGWNVTYRVGASHRNPDWFADPDRFDPDRFSPDRAEGKTPYRHIPFGAGMRECIGKDFARLEVEILMAKLLRDWDWALLPEQDLEFNRIPTLVPKDGLKVTFAARSAA